MIGKLTAVLLLCISALSLRAQHSAFQVNYEVIRKSVVFIYAQNVNGQVVPDGTGFLLVVPTKSDPKKAYLILVTARHMVDPAWTGCPDGNTRLIARFNKRGFNPDSQDSVGTVDYPLPSFSGPNIGVQAPWMMKWITPADESADVAFTVLNAPLLESMGAEAIPISLSDLARPDELNQMETGSQVMSAGLFPGVSGNRRNYPVFKFGYVSSRPSEKIILQNCPTGVARSESVWMIAASLVPGNSGSPILYVPVAFNGVSFGGYGQAVLIGIQSSSVVGWDIAGMTPISFLIDALKAATLQDADLSGLAETSAASQAK